MNFFDRANNGVSKSGFESEMERLKARIKRQCEEKKIDELRVWLFRNPEFKPDAEFFETFVHLSLTEDIKASSR